MWRRRQPSDDEFRDEMEAHVALETDRLVEEGLAPDDAAAAARRAFGNTTQVRERYYESRRILWLDDLVQDVRFTLRSLRRSPGFTAVALLTLAVGLGANTAIFSVVNAVLLRPLPYANADRLVLMEPPPVSGRQSASLMSAWRGRARSLEDFAPFGDPDAATMVAGGQPLQVEAARVAWNFFEVLGTSPVVGRVFSEADAGSDAPAVAILSHSFWVRQFGGDPEALGKTVTLTDVGGSGPLVVIGILPSEFRYPTPERTQYMPLFGRAQPDIVWLAGYGMPLRVLGRLSPGSTLEAASTELTDIFEQEAAAYYRRAGLAQRTTVVTSSLRDRLIGDARYQLLVVMGAVGCVLLVVCANIANLLLARVSSREPELAVRAALGARTTRLARLVLTESLLLAVLGSGAALLLAYWTGGLVRSMLADRVSHVEAVPIDWWVLVFNAALAAAVGVTSGLASMMGVRSGRLIPAFTQGGTRSFTGRSRLRHVLLAAEIATTFALVVSAALLCRTLWNLYHSERGYDGDRIVTAGVMPNMAGTISELQRLASAFFNDVTMQIGALPGVEAAAAAVNVPFSGASPMSGVSLVGQASASAEGTTVRHSAVTPGYFATIGTRLIAGRDFGRADSADRERVAIVNEAFRRRIAPGDPLVGAQIRFGRHFLKVIGIVEDLPDTSLRQPAEAFVYVPLAQTVGTNYMFGRLTILARTVVPTPRRLCPRSVELSGHSATTS